jgi:hypothetical protein
MNSTETTEKPKENGEKESFTGKELIPVGPQGVEFDSVQAMYRMARLVYDSGLCPSSFQNPSQIVIAWWTALELGIRPLQALNGMSVINGKATVGGDLALAIVEKSGELIFKKVTYTGEGKDLVCTVTLQRKGREKVDYTFSVKEAREAGLFDRKSSPWNFYPKRMTYYRALGFGLRDEFSDILKNVKTTEEVADYSPEREAVARVVDPIALNANVPPIVEQSPKTTPAPEEVLQQIRDLKETVAKVEPAPKVTTPAPVPQPEAETKAAEPEVKPEPVSQLPPEAKNGSATLQRVKTLAFGIMSDAELLEVVHALRLSNARDLADVTDSVLGMLAGSWETVRAVANTIKLKAANGR